jgi:hypothetical protein
MDILIGHFETAENERERNRRHRLRFVGGFEIETIAGTSR